MLNLKKSFGEMSLNELSWVMLGAAVGVGNFFTSPVLISKYGAVNFLFSHLAALLLLCAPLLCAEIIWGKWLRRPLHDSFEIFGKHWKHLATLVLLTLGLALPVFIFSFSEFITRALHLWGYVQGTWPAFDSIKASFLFYYLTSILVAVVGLSFSVLSKKKFTKLVKYLCIFSFSCWAFVAYFILNEWGFTHHSSLLQIGFKTVALNSFVEVALFSFYSVTMGCGIFYLLSHWLPKKRVEEGGVIRLCFFIIGGDFLASIFAFLILAPFIKYGAGFGDHGPVKHLFLELIPQSMMFSNMGLFMLVLLNLSLVIMGIVTIAVLYRVCVENLKMSLRQTTSSAIYRLCWWSFIALFLPVLPRLKNSMNYLAIEVLLPLAALVFMVAVQFKMPKKSQSLIIGRGFLLDPMIKIWRFFTYAIVFPFLIWVTLKHFL